MENIRKRFGLMVCSCWLVFKMHLFLCFVYFYFKKVLFQSENIWKHQHWVLVRTIKIKSFVIFWRKMKTDLNLSVIVHFKCQYSWSQSTTDHRRTVFMYFVFTIATHWFDWCSGNTICLVEMYYFWAIIKAIFFSFLFFC